MRVWRSPTSTAALRRNSQGCPTGKHGVDHMQIVRWRHEQTSPQSSTVFVTMADRVRLLRPSVATGHGTAEYRSCERRQPEGRQREPRYRWIVRAPTCDLCRGGRNATKCYRSRCYSERGPAVDSAGPPPLRLDSIEQYAGAGTSLGHLLRIPAGPSFRRARRRPHLPTLRRYHHGTVTGTTRGLPPRRPSRNRLNLSAAAQLRYHGFDR